MSTITIGTAGNKAVKIDLPTLFTTRLLVTADSGGGKTWALKRIVEQVFGKVPIQIIDPEGEFAALREQFGFVLIGQGGDLPADPRYAATYAHKMLEMKASVICDIYEMKVSARHEFVRAWCDALIEAPKKLRHPTIIIVDEAHMFCPEPRAGESIASDSIKALTTRGRKRGLVPIFATQRLAELDKGASSMMLNRLVGGTFEDVNQKRALDVLSVPAEEKRAFLSHLKLLEPGFFYGLGRAICRERTLIHIGKLKVTHGDNTLKYSTEPPPAPEAIRKLLPKLAELPKQAEEKAKTEAELKTEIRSLRAQLRAQPAPTKLISMDRYQRDVLIRRAVNEATREYSAAIDERDHIVVHLLRGLSRTREQAEKLAESARSFASGSMPEKIKTIPWAKQITAAKIPAGQIQKGDIPPAKRIISHVRPDAVPKNDEDITGPEQRILNAIAWLESVGIEGPEQTAVAFLAGYTYGGGGFNNPRGALKTKGMVEYLGGRITLTEAGRQLARAPEIPLTTKGLHEHVLKVLPGPEQKLLKVLLEIYPGDISNEELAERAGYTPGSGGFNNPRGRLRSLGLVHYPKPGRVIANDLLFVQD